MISPSNPIFYWDLFFFKLNGVFIFFPSLFLSNFWLAWRNDIDGVQMVRNILVRSCLFLDYITLGCLFSRLTLFIIFALFPVSMTCAHSHFWTLWLNTNYLYYAMQLNKKLIDILDLSIFTTFSWWRKWFNTIYLYRMGIISSGLFLNITLLSQILRQIVEWVMLLLSINLILILQLNILLPWLFFIVCSGVSSSSRIFLLVFSGCHTAHLELLSIVELIITITRIIAS